MQRHRDGELTDLVRNTIIWIAVVIFLAASYVLQDPAGDPYTQAVRNVFTIILVVLVPLVSAVVIFAWVGALRHRSGR
jgi:heme/copper-type cytochrome/quinol oxidase subunit 2